MASRSVPAPAAAGGMGGATSPRPDSGAPEKAQGDSAGDAPHDAATNGTLLYHQTIIPTQGITHTVRGSFTLPGETEVVLIRHSTLELWRVQGDGGGSSSSSGECIHSCPLFATVMAAAAVPTGFGGGASAAGGGPSASASASSMAASGGGGPTQAALFPSGAAYDYLIVTSETGYATLLRYQLAEPPVATRSTLLRGSGGDDDTAAAAASTFVMPSLRGCFVKVAEVCLSRSGARLTSPAARVAVDPNGGAIMFGALMRNKIVVPLRRTDFGSGSSSGAGALAWLGAGAQGGSGAWTHHRKGGNRGDGEDGYGDSGDDEGDGDGDGAAVGLDGTIRVAQLKRRMETPRGLLALGSPIEAHRQTVTLSMCALDGFVDTSLFAVLEMDTVEAAGAGTTDGENTNNNNNNNREEEKSKFLVIYAHVPSLKQVQRTHLVRLPASAHRLVPVPAAPYGPGGVLVCTDADLIWYDFSPTAYANNTAGSGSGSGSVVGVFKCVAPLPRRASYADTMYDPSIIAHATTCVRQDFFMLLQDEQGDLFRVFIPTTRVQAAYDALKAAAAGAGAAAPRHVNPLSAHYFDTIPPAADMALFPRGYILAAAEGGAFHGLYKIFHDGYKAESAYIVKRVKRVREVVTQGPAVVDAKRPRASKDEAADGEPSPVKKEEKEEEEEEGSLQGGGVAVKKEKADDSAEEEGGGSGAGHSQQQQQQSHPGKKKPAVTGKLLAMLPPKTTTQTVTRVIALYNPHRGLKHIGRVHAYPNTPPILGFTAAIPSSSSSSSAAAGGGDMSSSGDASGGAGGGGQEQPQLQFNLVAGRGAGSVLLNARFGYATRREGRHLLEAPAEEVLCLLSASGLQHLVSELEDAVGQAQGIAAATDTTAVLGDHPTTAATAVSSRAERARALQRLQAASNSRHSLLRTDKIVVTTSQGMTAVYHVGATIEKDWWTGFATKERTLAVATLKYGVGFVQVTARGIHALPPVPPSAQGAGGAAAAALAAPTWVQPTHWTHKHGKPILAAAASPTTVLVSFAQGGGIASFNFGTTGGALEMVDELPTFPVSSAVSLLQPPMQSLTGDALNRQLNALLYGSKTDHHHHSSNNSRHAMRGAEELQLAAIATITQEVYLVDPLRLREPLETIRCTDDTADGHNSNNNRMAITSVLLTYLGGAADDDNYTAMAGASSPSSASRQQQQQQQRRRRLFCFIGHLGGSLTRCELHPTSARLVDKVVLSCGTAPVVMVAGDGQSACYVQSGANAWRCELRGGVAKVVPWRFTAPQRAFAKFSRPRSVGVAPAPAPSSTHATTTAATTTTTTAAQSTTTTTADGQQNGQYDEEAAETAPEVVFITAAAGGAGSSPAGGGGDGSGLADECIIGVLGRELTLFTAQQSGSGASALEYSFTARPLPSAARRIYRHPTRPSYHVIVATEHRSYSLEDIRKMRQEEDDRVAQEQAARAAAAADNDDDAPAPAPPAVVSAPIPLDAPQRSLGRADVYNSTLQLYLEAENQILPRYFFPAGDAAMCTAVGSFVEGFGREPVVVVGVASSYTHGAGCGRGASWSRGWLCTFRFAAGGSGGGGGRGEPVLRLEAHHRTLIRSDTDAATGEPHASDYPSAVHINEDVGLLFVGLSERHGLRIYVWGQRHFLRKRHLPDVPSRIVAITSAWAPPPPGSASAAGSGHTVTDLYCTPASNAEAQRRAREERLLVYCATAHHSVLVAALQPGAPGGGIPSFLMIVARDAVPRGLTPTLAVLRDGRTVAAADRFGNVVFLRTPPRNRLGFSMPVTAMRDAEIAQASKFITEEQFLEEVACHATGQVVTALQSLVHDPSAGADPALAVELVLYGTAMGAVGSYSPFVAEEDAALAAYAQPLLAQHARCLVGPQTGALPAHIRGKLIAAAGTAPTHHIVEGDLLSTYRQSNTAAASLFPEDAKAAVEEALQRDRRVETARRKVLGLPPRELPSLDDLVAKQRALATLPQ